MKDGRARVTAQVEATFLVEGFTNWKKATEKFAKHEKSDFHRICFQAVSSTVDVGDMLNQQAATEKQQNRDCLLKILSTMRFLARQGLALRGDGDESNSNLHQCWFHA